MGSLAFFSHSFCVSGVEIQFVGVCVFLFLLVSSFFVFSVGVGHPRVVEYLRMRTESRIGCILRRCLGSNTHRSLAIDLS